MARNAPIGIRAGTPSRLLAGIAALVAVTASSLPAHGQALVYKPTNPSFGGDAFNSSHLLSIANAQNDYKAAAASASSATDLFVRQLQSRLLSSLASQVNDAIFGENPQDSGTITFGEQVISFERGLDSVQLVIVDNAAGTRTEIEIPLLGASTNAASSLGLGGTGLDLAPATTSGGDLTSAVGGF